MSCVTSSIYVMIRPLARLNISVVHPFREGNGRTQRILFEHLIMNAGFEISWWGVEPDQWIHANIAAFNCDLGPMEDVFERCIGRPIQA